MTTRRISVRGGGVPDVRDGLRIDREDLDGCLIEQPDRYWRAAEAHVQARAELDGLKLRLDETVARLDRRIRERAEVEEKKVTEGSIDKEIKLHPDYCDLRRQMLDATARAELAQALKESYSQRSFMLRELVALQISERGAQAGAGGAYEARARRADEASAARGDALRRERRGGAGA